MFGWRPLATGGHIPPSRAPLPVLGSRGWPLERAGRVSSGVGLAQMSDVGESAPRRAETPAPTRLQIDAGSAYCYLSLVQEFAAVSRKRTHGECATLRSACRRGRMCVVSMTDVRGVRH